MKVPLADQVVPRKFEPTSIPSQATSPSASERFARFCQFQAEQLTAQSTIAFVQITAPGSHRVQATNASNYLTTEILEKVQQEDWLTEFPVAFTINPIRLNHTSEAILYFCPYSYYQQQCHYLLIIADKILSPIVQQLIQQTALMLNESLEQSLEQSQQHQRIQFLEQVLQRVGHQLRQPLSLISLYANNLNHQLSATPLGEQATIIKETIQDLDRQLTELIVCSSDTLRLTEHDLRELAIECFERFQPWIDEKHLRINYPKTSIRLMVDRLQMKQVFDNLISNAIHFSPLNGTIRLNWQVFHHEVLVTIADQGTGLSPEDLQRLFVPFYSRRPGGTGLGLAIAQKVVQDHRGNLWARNLAKGAEFSISLPRSVPVLNRSERELW